MMKTLLTRINFGWRVLATGMSFSMFGIGGLILGYIILPTIQLISKDKRKSKLRARCAVSYTFRLFTRIMRGLGILTYQFTGLETLSNDKRFIYVSNHPSLLDIVFLVSRLKHINVVVKEKLWKDPFMKRIIKIVDYIPNIQSEETAIRIADSLKEGDNLLIFPEGTRTTPNQPLILQRGAANLSLRTPAPIRLIRIKTTANGLTKTDKWYNVPKTKIRYEIEIAGIVNPATFMEQASNLPSLAARRLTRHLTDELSKGIHLEQ